MGEGARARDRIEIEPLPVRFLAEGLEAVGRLTEISRAGVFIKTEEFPRPGAVLAVQFHTPSGQLVDLRGEVRWSTQGLAAHETLTGFGVSIHEAPPAYLDFFRWVEEQAEKDEKADQAKL